MQRIHGRRTFNLCIEVQLPQCIILIGTFNINDATIRKISSHTIFQLSQSSFGSSPVLTRMKEY